MLCSMKKEYPQIVLGLVFARQVALVMLDRLAGWRLKKLVLARIAEMDGGPLVGELGEPEIINCFSWMEVSFLHYRLFHNIINFPPFV